jgi:hypothetical protein
MSDVRATPGVPTIDQFAGITTPSACAPIDYVQAKLKAAMPPGVQ